MYGQTHTAHTHFFFGHGSRVKNNIIISYKNSSGPHVRHHMLSEFTRPVHHHSLGGNPGMFLDGLQNIHELDLGGQCMAVVDVGVAIWSIPAVH